ncbi:MAG TPA: acyltransferase family protein, partial [Opitutaceae bacterium]|nr:acyltransferase family protein [Opitutaceae bacterium]
AVLLALNRGAPDLNRAFAAGALLCLLPAVVKLDDPRTLPLVLWPEFFAGACVSFARRAAAAPRRGIFVAAIGVVTALAAITFLGAGSYDNVGHRAAIAFAAALYALAPIDRRMMTWNVVRLLGWFGAFSYSLYLLHVPIVSRLMNLAARLTAPSGAAFAAAWIAALAFTVLAGWLCWRYVEQPFERRRMAARRLALPRREPALHPAA